MEMKKKAVFLDRDGTLNVDDGYPSSFHEIVIYPASYEAVRKLNSAGLLAIVITNQSGIGRGLLTENDLAALHCQMSASFSNQGARLDAFYYCPHYERSTIPHYRLDCSCRKPNAGLALRAAADFSIDLERSYMIGDKVEDILFGLTIKATSILVRTGFGEESLPRLLEAGAKPSFVAEDILEAADWILGRETKAR
jgi:D-glycero-D-manno-heptose 1,7-bisphosphate phosphatase